MGGMRTVTLYWNHICIMHNFEKEHLGRVRDRLLRHSIDLRVTYFGMGYDGHMSSYLRKDNALLPDIMVSADLEVFENARIAEKIGACHPALSWIERKDTPAVRAVVRDEALLPFVIIPLTAYGNASCEGHSFLEMVEQKRVAFGGIDNSAAKTVVKAVWERYGEQAARKVLTECRVTNMPIEVSRRRGSAPSMWPLHRRYTGCVPTAYPGYIASLKRAPFFCRRTFALAKASTKRRRVSCAMR